MVSNCLARELLVALGDRTGDRVAALAEEFKGYAARGFGHGKMKVGRTPETPMNPLVHMVEPTFATVSLAVAYGLFFGNVVLLPLWLQQYMGYTATDAGMVMAPVGVLAMVLSPLVGRTVGKIDAPTIYGEALKPEFKTYAKRVIENARALADVRPAQLADPKLFDFLALGRRGDRPLPDAHAWLAGDPSP